MARINPWDDRLKRPARPEATRTYPDPLNPGETFSITLRKLDIPTLNRVAEVASELQAEMLGTPDQPGTGFVCPDKGPILLTPALLQSVATLMLMQVPTEGEDPYNETDLLGLAVNLPDVWKDLTITYAHLQHGGPLPGNPQRASTGTSSDSSGAG